MQSKAIPPLLSLIDRRLGPLGCAELFALSNIAFLAVDIYLAHSVNAFDHKAEWIPVVFSPLASLALGLALLLGGVHPPLATDAAGPGPQTVPRTRSRRLGLRLGLLIGWLAITVGVAGMMFHLNDTFFRRQTLHELVYTAPFVAPLAYAGLGLLLLLNRMVPAASAVWARWVIFLALGGMFGNFVLSLADHAQNGFFDAREWTGVVAGAVGTGVLLAVLVVPHNRPWLWLSLGVMGLEALVGVAGTWFHLEADLHGQMGSLWENLLYGAPVFAPLLFANLAALAAIGLWALLRQTGDRCAEDQPVVIPAP